MGNLFLAYSSSNGRDWREHARLTMVLPNTVYFGFAHVSHNTAQLGTCVFQLQTTRQQNWYYLSRNECIQCHNTNAGGILGPKIRNINSTLAYPDNGMGDGTSANQIHAWNHIGLFHRNVDDAEIATLPRMVHYTQTSEPLENRARSYIDPNCAHSQTRKLSPQYSALSPQHFFPLHPRSLHPFHPRNLRRGGSRPRWGLCPFWGH